MKKKIYKKKIIRGTLPYIPECQ